MMDRRLFLKVNGLLAVATAFATLPMAAWAKGDRIPDEQGRDEPAPPDGRYPPGTYRLTGRVRLQQSVVEIGGITNTQQISWAGMGAAGPPVAGFTSFEDFDRPWSARDVRVRGGQLEALSAVRIVLD